MGNVAYTMHRLALHAQTNLMDCWLSAPQHSPPPPRSARTPRFFAPPSPSTEACPAAGGCQPAGSPAASSPRWPSCRSAPPGGSAATCASTASRGCRSRGGPPGASGDSSRRCPPCGPSLTRSPRAHPPSGRGAGTGSGACSGGGRWRGSPGSSFSAGRSSGGAGWSLGWPPAAVPPSGGTCSLPSGADTHCQPYLRAGRPVMGPREAPRAPLLLLLFRFLPLA
jgi:hypothetical protein